MMIDFYHAMSYLGSPIHVTEEARANDARRFFRVCVNLGLGRRSTLEKFSRYIRFGFLSCSDAQDLLLQRLPVAKLRRYQLAKYWIVAGFVCEDWFYFNSSALWPVEKEAESIIPFL